MPKRTHLFAARSSKVKSNKGLHGWNAKGGKGGYAWKSTFRKRGKK